MEEGTIFGHGRRKVALVYPSPYPVAMSSLGFQAVYGDLNAIADTSAERAFLPDADDAPHGALCTYESGRPAGDFPVVAFSVAYELEIGGIFSCLQRMGIALLRRDRSPTAPFVVMGGPLTFSNPAPLGPFADVVVMGEAEELLAPLLDVLFSGMSKEACLQALAERAGFYVPHVHGDVPPPVAQCRDALLPAASVVRTPDTALANMHLVETERGCSRGCTFCVMRRSTNGGMRVVPMERILATIPEGATRVGLVGAAVSDHPRIVQIARSIVDSGRDIGLSSLRSDRLTEEFVAVLMRGGYRTLTVASDGASERLRIGMQKKIRARHLLRAAELARDAGMAVLKVYMMIGAPDETDEDIDELIAFTKEQARVAGHKTRVALGIAPFVAKRNTPLAGYPFLGVKRVQRRLERVRRGLMPQVTVRPTSARWAWVEHALAQGGAAVGMAALEAWRQGGGFSAWKAALGALGVVPDASSAPQFPLLVGEMVG